MSRTKKSLLFFFAATVVVLLICNYRVPFFKTSAGYWSVGYGESDVFPEKMQIDRQNIFSIAQLTAADSTSEFLADPFFVKEKGQYYIFFEHKHKTYHPAEIGVLVSPDGKNYAYKGSVLRESFHLSYPQVFKYKGEFYMLPESQAGNNVMVYKTENFPYGWKVCDTLIADTRLKDPTLYISDTLNIIIGTDSNLTMHLYRADSLFGKWTKHKKSKMLMGTESRPGGRLFNDGNGLILPVQRSTKCYGSGLSLYRLKFDGDENYTLEREKELYLEGQENIPEFAAGMHQLDIQKIDGKFYYVYDGIDIKDDKGVFAPYASLKANFYDLRNWLHRTFN